MNAFKCIDTRGNVREFATHSAAATFVMNEGDKSSLWSLEPVRPFIAEAMERARIADKVFQDALAAARLGRWDMPPEDMPELVKIARGGKVRADETMHAAFEISRGRAVDVTRLLVRDDDFAVNALVISGAFTTNVEVLNALCGFTLTAAEWRTAFGGEMAFGQGAIQDAIWSRVRAVRHAVEAARETLT